MPDGYGDSDDGYGTEGYGSEDAPAAPDAEFNAGACPPSLKRYRIYPEIDFTAEFSSPPDNVIT